MPLLFGLSTGVEARHEVERQGDLDGSMGDEEDPCRATID
jgi:hypothetical protein